MPSDDNMMVSLAAPSAPQWFSAMDRRKRFYHVGHCNNTFQASLRSVVCSWLQYKDDPVFPLTPNLRRCGFMCDSYAMDKGIDVPTELPPSYIESIAKWRELAPDTGISKAILPAFVPSVRFNYDFIRQWRESNEDDKTKKYLSAKALAGKDPRAWNHAGLFCIDIDVGHDGNPGTPDSLYEQALKEGPMTDMPGFLFSFASPNQGIKMFFTVDAQLFEKLNTPDGCESIDLSDPRISSDLLAKLQIERERMHAICFYALADQVSKHTGLAVDLTCSDPCRLQFMFRAYKDRLVVNPSLLDSRTQDSELSFFKFSSPEAYREAEERAAKKGVGSNDLLPRNFQPGDYKKPPIIHAFCKWLYERGWEKESKHVMAMRPVPEGYVSYCTQCLGVSTTASGDRDLLLWIDKDSPGRFGFKCFHSSCSSRDKVRYPYWYLAKLFQDEQESNRIAEATTGSYTVPDILRRYIAASAVRGKRKKGLANRIGMNSSYIKNPDSLPNFFQFDEKSGALLANAPNVNAYVQHCMNLHPVYNLDLCCTEFINPDTGSRYSFDDIRKEVVGYFNDRCSKDVSKFFINGMARRANRLIYSPLFVMGHWEEWDGTPRVDKYIDLLEWDPEHEPPKVMKKDGTYMTGQEWKRHALRSWLVTCWERVVCSVYNLPSIQTDDEESEHDMPENKMIILCSETQGVGKTQWVKNLVSREGKAAMVTTDTLENSKDHDKLSAIKPIFFIDEMEKTTRDEKMSAHLKMVLTRDQIDIRDPYDRDITSRPVITSFIGATNEPKPLSDADGARRLILLYVRRPADKMQDINNCPEHVKEMQSLNVPQFWAEIKYMSETAEPGEYRLTGQEKSLVQYNKTTGLENGEFTHLSNYLRYVRVEDKDFEGKKLRKHIDPSFNDSANIINWVRKELGEKEIKVTYRNSKQFRQHLLSIAPKGAPAQYYAGGRSSKRIQLFAFLPEKEFEMLASDEARRAWAEEYPEEAANYYKRKKYTPTEGDLDVMNPEWKSRLEFYKPYYDAYFSEDED